MKKKIMIVDDEPDQLATVKITIEEISDEYEVIPIDSGEQCLQQLMNNNIPDIIHESLSLCL